VSNAVHERLIALTTASSRGVDGPSRIRRCDPRKSTPIPHRPLDTSHGGRLDKGEALLPDGSALAIFLSMVAIPFVAWLHCKRCRGHFLSDLVATTTSKSAQCPMEIGHPMRATSFDGRLSTVLVRSESHHSRLRIRGSRRLAIGFRRMASISPDDPVSRCDHVLRANPVRRPMGPQCNHIAG